MVDSRKIIDERVAQDVIICLNKQFGDSYANIAEKTGLREESISRAARGEGGLTSKDLGRIEDSYEMPFAAILLASIKQRDASSPTEMKLEHVSLRGVLLASAEVEEDLGRLQGKKYRNWRELI